MPHTRRQFLAAAGPAGLSLLTLPLAADDAPPRTLRVIAYNIYVAKGWPDNRPLAKQAVSLKQMARRLALELALYEPDIINFSESPSEEICQEIAGYLGMQQVRFPSGGKWPGTLLSRFEITESQNVPLGGPRPDKLFTRHWGRGVIRLPGDTPLIVHSAHLFPGEDPSVRMEEIRAMLTAMQADIASGASMLLIGDLNHPPDSQEYELWKQAGWVDTFAVAGDGEGPTIKADHPQYRIDYVLARGPIALRIREARPLFEGAFRLNTADPASFALSDHLPQLAVFDVQP